MSKAWYDVWDITFYRLTDGERDNMHSELFLESGLKISGLTHEEVIDAIRLLDEQGEKAKIGNLRRLIFKTRARNTPNNSRKAFNAEYKRIRAILLAEPDRLKRWEMMCELTPNNDNEMCDMLRGLCDKPDLSGLSASVQDLTAGMTEKPKEDLT